MGRRPDALPAGLVGFSACRRLQKLSSAPRALARLQLDVYDNNGNFLNSIGDSNYQDYPSYILTYNLEYADK